MTTKKFIAIPIAAIRAGEKPQDCGYQEMSAQEISDLQIMRAAKQERWERRAEKSAVQAALNQEWADPYDLIDDILEAVALGDTAALEAMRLKRIEIKKRARDEHAAAVEVIKAENADLVKPEKTKNKTAKSGGAA